MKLGTKAVTVRLPQDEYVFLRTTAASDGKSMGSWAEEVISRELRERAKDLVSNGQQSLAIAKRVMESKDSTGGDGSHSTGTKTVKRMNT